MDVENESNTEESLTHELCRLCANTDKQLIPIFQGEGIEHNIAEQIEKYLPIIRVTQNDKLPLHICYQCTSTLIAWHNFFEQCRCADDRLREILPVNDKFNQDDESCHDCVDDLDDFEDYDNPQVECVLVEPTVGDVQVPTSSDGNIPAVSDAQISIVSEAQIPIVSDAQSSSVDDAQILKTNDNGPVNVSKDVSKSVTENLIDSRNAESVEEKWDPLIKTPQTYSALFAEGRDKLVTSKQLGALVRKCKGVDVTVLDSDPCPAFVIDNDDFVKRRITGVNEEPSGVTATESGLSAGAKRGSSALAISSKPKDGGETKSSGNQNLMIKIGGHVAMEMVTVPQKKMISSQNSSRLKDNRATEGNVERLKRKLGSAEPVAPEATDEDADSCLTKKRKKCAQPDESEANSPAEDVSRSVGNCDSELTSSADRLGSVRVANFAKGGFSDQQPGSGGVDLKSEPSKKTRLRRAPRDEGNGEAGEETFTCAHCLRSFGRKSNLRRHMLKLHCAGQKSAGLSSSRWFTGYCCDVCGEGLQHRPTMMAHRDVVHGAQPEMDWVKYRTSLARVKFCDACKRYFRSGGPFEQHDCDGGESVDDAGLAARVRSAEEARPSFVCAVCGVCFRWKWDYRLHRETEHGDAAPLDWATVVGGEVAHLCASCSKAYASAEALAAHACAVGSRQQQAPAAETTKQYRCKLCEHEYFWKSDYRRHMRLKHPQEHCRPTEHDTIVYTCPYCDDKFALKRGVLQHMRKAHKVNSDSPFVCAKCNKVFRRRDNLDRHNESYHPAAADAAEARRLLAAAEIRINGDRSYRCAVCSRTMADADRFVAHCRGHSAQTRFKCDLCDKQTRTQHQLNTHIKNIHLNIRNYRCDFCEKSFYTKQACEEHRRTHTGERPYSCEICGKTFVAGNALISHKRFHNDFYPHACQLCDKKFKVRRSLVNHVRTHTGERPFECELCAKTFNNSSQFSYHKRVTHSEERPFACPVCGNRFKTAKFLARHAELHELSRAPASPRKGARRKRAIAEETAVASGDEEEVVMVAPPAAIAGDVVAERGIKIFVSAPAVAAAAPPAGEPSIVNVVSTRSTTILKGVSAVGGAIVDVRDENILPGPSPVDAQAECDRRGPKSAASRSTPSAFLTTLEYIEVTEGEFKPVITGETYVALQPDSGSYGAGERNSSWL